MTPSTRWLAVASALALAGCEVRERMAWSPDGRTAALWSSGELYLADPAGALSGPFTNEVVQAAWAADGEALIVVRQLAVTSWAEYAAVAPPNERRAVEGVAPAVLPLLRGLRDAAGGDPQRIAALVGERFGVRFDRGDLLAPLALCVRDTRPDDWRELRTLLPESDLDTPITATVWEVGALRITAAETSSVRRLMTVSASDVEVRPSPRRPWLAIRAGPRLSVWAVTGPTGTLEIAETVPGGFDWMGDGERLACAVPVMPVWRDNAPNLAHLQVARIAVDGPEWRAVSTQTLMAVVCPFRPLVRALGNDQIVLPAAPSRFPHDAADAPPPPRLMVVRPAEAQGLRSEVRVLDVDGLPDDLRAIVPSPDGRHIAIVESGSDAVAVLDLDGQSVRPISPRRGRSSLTLPAWRNAEELYFPATGGTPDRFEWFLWRGGAVQPWSTGWPEAAQPPSPPK